MARSAAGRNPGLDFRQGRQARRGLGNQRENGEAARDLDRRRGLAGLEGEGGGGERRATADPGDDLIDAEGRRSDEHHGVVVGERFQLRFSGEAFRTDAGGELRRLGLRLGVGTLGGEAGADLGLGLGERLLPGGTLLEHLDQVETEARADRSDQRIRLGVERRLFELLDHAAAAEESEIATPRLGGRIVRELGRELGEVLAGVDALARREDGDLGRLGRPRIVDLEQDVARADLLFLLEFIEVRVVVALEVGLLEGHLGSRSHRVDQEIVDDALRRQAELVGVALEIARDLRRRQRRLGLESGRRQHEEAHRGALGLLAVGAFDVGLRDQQGGREDRIRLVSTICRRIDSSKSRTV